MDIALISILGLIIGSFIAAFTYRIPRGIDFVYGRSFCDSCKMDLFWYDNIPLLSFLFYQGKSRCCNKKIGVRYPVIELSVSIGFILLFSASLSPIYYLLSSICLAIFVIDIEHQIIPDELTWLLILFSLCTTNNVLYIGLFAGFFTSFLLLVLYLITKGRGIGLGDVKFAIPICIILGFEKSLYWIAASFILGGIVASVLLILKLANMKTKIAFGPFMIVAFWAVFLFGDYFF